MKGATDYARLFRKTHQYEKLYFVVSSHARGDTFRVFILPEGEDAIANGSSNAPLNSEAVEVYGVVSGNPGWTEAYGWLHCGAWQCDFAKYERHLKGLREREAASRKAKILNSKQEEEKRTLSILSKY
jgi:hypothetical protein